MATQIPDFNKIYSLNDYKIKEVPILNKYMPFKYLKENIENNKIVFVSPKTWRDPFERLYYSAENYKKYNNFKKPNIFCMCLTKNASQNEDAAWKMYHDGTTEKILRVTFNVEKMLKQLDIYCLDNNFSIYIGDINYCFEKLDAITTLHKISNPKHNDYFKDDFGIENYLQLLLIKRKAFEFEQEVRIFLVPDDENVEDLSQKTLFPVSFNCHDGAIMNLTIAPLQPFPMGDPRQENYDKLQKIEEIAYKDALSQLLPELNSTKINQSHLYKSKNIIKL